ncbi:29123_t:CDS:1, partial [Racocetra persica]
SVRSIQRIFSNISDRYQLCQLSFTLSHPESISHQPSSTSQNKFTSTVNLDLTKNLDLAMNLDLALHLDIVIMIDYYPHLNDILQNNYHEIDLYHVIVIEDQQIKTVHTIDMVYI